MRTSMAMTALLWSGFGWPRGAARAERPPVRGRAGGAEGSAGAGGAGTAGAGEPAQVDVQARHEADARGLSAHIDGTHGLIV
ncbi:hypothetical protein GCM10009760_31110 [Kitasatospora kazusensis]|uniref:Uncharacterized protein n=1 Tax=Kitasatospora kazusensis TaxID=407974 RepID=A0ABP5LD86_9ACTN